MSPETFFDALTSLLSQDTGVADLSLSCTDYIYMPTAAVPLS